MKFRHAPLALLLVVAVWGAASPSASAQSTNYSTLASFGTDGLSIPSDAVGSPAFLQTVDGLSFSQTISAGDGVGGWLLPDPQDWSEYVEFGLLISFTGSSPAMPFSLQLWDSGTEPKLINTYQAATPASDGPAATIIYVPLALAPELDEYGNATGLRGSGDLSRVSGIQLIWDADSESENVNVNVRGLGVSEKQGQTITFDPVGTKIFGDAPFQLAASATSGLPLSFASSDESVATVADNGMVTIVGAGQTMITANQAGNTVFEAAPEASQVLIINKASQSIVFPLMTGRLPSAPPFPLGATVSSGLPLTFASSDESVATVADNGVVTIIAAGETTITASQDGDANHEPALPVDRTLIVAADPLAMAKHLGKGVYLDVSGRVWFDPDTMDGSLLPGTPMGGPKARILANIRGAALPKTSFEAGYDNLQALLGAEAPASLGARIVSATTWEVVVPNFTKSGNNPPQFASLTIHNFNPANGRLRSSQTLNNPAQLLSVLGRERTFDLDFTGDGIVGDGVLRSLGQGLYVTVSGRVWFDPDNTDGDLARGQALGSKARFLANNLGTALAKAGFESGYDRLQTLLGQVSASLGARVVNASTWEVVLPVFQTGPLRFASLTVYTFNATTGRLIRTTNLSSASAVYEREMIYNIDLRGDGLIGFPRIYVRAYDGEIFPQQVDGSSWAKAFGELQAAIDAASSGQEIWVAEGTYLPTRKEYPRFSFVDPSDERSRTFVLKAGVRVYGGFKPDEDTNRLRRSGGPSILSGDLEGNDDSFWMSENGDLSVLYDNTYHVVLADNLAAPTLLDGLVIRGGFAVPDPETLLQEQYSVSDDPDNYGGGIVSLASQLELRNCVVERNIASAGGGGMFAFAGPLRFGDDTLIAQRTPRILRVFDTIFSQNFVTDYELSQTAYLSGGAVAIGDNYQAEFRNVRFELNSAPNGGAVSVQTAWGLEPVASSADYPQVRLYGCQFVENEAVCSPPEQVSEEPLAEEEETLPLPFLRDGAGGAIYAGHLARVDLAGSFFRANRAWNPKFHEGTGGGHGGAIAVETRGRVRVATSVFSSNESDWAGGAVNAANWDGEGTGTTLQVSLSTLYENRAPWGAGVSNYKANVSGRANIFLRNISPASEQLGKDEFFSDIGNTVQVNSVSSISHSIFTQNGSANRNNGVGNQVFQNPETVAPFVDPSSTTAVGFRLKVPFVISRVTVALPGDFADANGNGNLTELLPFDAGGKRFGSAPFDRGAFQR